MKSSFKILIMILAVTSSSCKKKYNCSCTTTNKTTGEQTKTSWARRYPTIGEANKECSRNEMTTNSDITTTCEFH